MTSERYIGKSVRMTIEGKTSNGAITRVKDLAGKRLRERERQGGNERVLEKYRAPPRWWCSLFRGWNVDHLAGGDYCVPRLVEHGLDSLVY